MTFSVAVEVDLIEPNRGVTMRARHASTNIPMNIVPLGTKVYLSIEFVKGKDEGMKTVISRIDMLLQ